MWAGAVGTRFRALEGGLWAPFLPALSLRCVRLAHSTQLRTGMSDTWHSTLHLFLSVCPELNWF
jgi:hypothetical protein